MENEKIGKVKNYFYQVMDGLNGLLDVLDDSEVSKEKASTLKALKIMRIVDLERFWMRTLKPKNEK